MSRLPSPSEAAWAAAKAAEHRAAIAALPKVTGGDWRGVRRRMATIAFHRREAIRLDAIASRCRPREDFDFPL